MYDLTRSESFYNVSDWLSEIRANSDPDVVIYLVGNRYDLQDEEREITPEDGERFMKENKLDGFMESSAKSGHNVEKTFAEIARALLKAYADKMTPEEPLVAPVVIRPTNVNKPKKKSCC